MLIIEWLKRLSNVGHIPDKPHSFENKRILLLNKIAIISIIITQSIVIIHLVIGNIVQPLVVSSGLLIAAPTLWFQHKRKYQLARNWFLIGLFFLISIIFFHSVYLRLDTATEYVLVILIPMTLIFLDGRPSTFSTIFIMISGGVFIALRSFESQIDSKELYGLEINWFTISSAIFFCVVFFKRSLLFVNETLEKDREKLTRINQTKNFLFGVISHDIRSPLSTLKQYLLLDPSSRQDPEKFMIYQEGLIKKVDEISNTLNDLLYWSKTQLQGIQTHPSTFQISEVVKGILPVVQELIKVKKITFNINDQALNPIWCDKDHLTVIIRNLIQNALKFTPANGNLTIETYDELDAVVIKVVDNGAGMDELTLKNLKEGMIVESHLGTSGEVGTGLGLSLVKDLIQKNDGIFNIRSEVNVGTEISIRLPSKV